MMVGMVKEDLRVTTTEQRRPTTADLAAIDRMWRVGQHACDMHDANYGKCVTVDICCASWSLYMLGKVVLDVLDSFCAPPDSGDPNMA